jgi:hypothetical protein
LVAVTEIVPPAAPAVAVMDVEVELPLHPDGKVHIYDVAPETADILYDCDEPSQTDVAPVMVPGWEGVVITVMLSNLAVPEPHELLAVTPMDPPVEPTVAVMDVDVELPLHPDGNVHV